MDIKDKLKEIEEQVSIIKDSELRKIAFEKLLDSFSVLKKSKTIPRKEIKGNKKRLTQKSGRPGPKKILHDLLSSGFFDNSRIISEIIAHIKLKTGHNYKANELSPSLLRILRDGYLAREKNDKGKYEWKKA